MMGGRFRRELVTRVSSDAPPQHFATLVGRHPFHLLCQKTGQIVRLHVVEQSVHVDHVYEVQRVVLMGTGAMKLKVTVQFTIQLAHQPSIVRTRIVDEVAIRHIDHGAVIVGIVWCQGAHRRQTGERGRLVRQRVRPVVALRHVARASAEAIRVDEGASLAAATGRDALGGGVVNEHLHLGGRVEPGEAASDRVALGGQRLRHALTLRQAVGRVVGRTAAGAHARRLFDDQVAGLTGDAQVVHVVGDLGAQRDDCGLGGVCD